MKAMCTATAWVLVFLSITVTGRFALGAEEAAPAPKPLGTLSVTPGPAASGRVIGQEDSGRDIELRTGETFRVDFVVKGGVGVGWKLEPIDEKYLLYVSRTGKPLEPKARGYVLISWYFQTVSPGVTELKMTSTAKDGKEFKVRLNITERR